MSRMRHISLSEDESAAEVQPKPPVLTLYRVTASGPDWVVRYWVRAADSGKAIRYVRNTNQQLFNTTAALFSVSKQDDSKGVVFGPY